MQAIINLEYTGTLIAPAQARTTILDGEGHTVPVLCIDIELDNLERTRMHVEQVFPSGKHVECAAAARRYKTGQRVTFETANTSITLTARYASHIHLHPDAAPAAQQLDQVATPSLF